MRIIHRKPGQSIHISDNIVATVFSITNDSVRIDIDTPPDIPIIVHEIYVIQQLELSELQKYTCPLCGCQPTMFAHPFSSAITLPFKDQQCSNQECKLPCKLWDQIKKLQLQ